MATTAAARGITEALPEGPTVTVRPIGPDDADALVRFHARLSDETTYRRYFTIHRTLRPAELERFTHVDHRDREALVALDDEDQIVGVGRYDRAPGSTSAEGAFVVCDDWQGLGLGPVLVRHTIDHARANGVITFTAETLTINRPMLTVFRRTGYPMDVRTEGCTLHITLDVSQDRDQPAPAGQLGG